MRTEATDSTCVSLTKKRSTIGGGRPYTTSKGDLVEAEWEEVLYQNFARITRNTIGWLFCLPIGLGVIGGAHAQNCALKPEKFPPKFTQKEGVLDQ